jgi:hypothetical protein
LQTWQQTAKDFNVFYMKTTVMFCEILLLVEDLVQSPQDSRAQMRIMRYTQNWRGFPALCQVKKNKVSLAHATSLLVLRHEETAVFVTASVGRARGHGEGIRASRELIPHENCKHVHTRAQCQKQSLMTDRGTRIDS